MSVRFIQWQPIKKPHSQPWIAGIISLVVLLTACSRLSLTESTEASTSDPYVAFTEAVTAVEPLLDPNLDELASSNPRGISIVNGQFERRLPPLTPLAVEGNLTLVTSPDLLPLNEALYQRFIQEGYSGVMDINAMTASAAIQQFCQQSHTHLLTVNREMTPAEAADCRAKGRTPIRFAIGKDALVLVVNPQDTFVRGVTLAKLKTIFTANTWSSVESTWPTEPINRALIGPDSAAIALLAKTLFANNPDTLLKAPNTTVYDYPEPLTQALSLTPYSMGIVNYSTYQQLSKGFRAVPINGVSASAKTIENGVYPLGQTAFLYGAQQQLKSPTVTSAAINFYLTRVNAVIAEVSLLPLTDAQLNQSKDQWLKIMGLAQPSVEPED
ncbi:MAG: substrate-binding domain-containing protein [Cyanobacteria bacterium P01_F01_bin.53]